MGHAVIHWVQFGAVTFTCGVGRCWRTCLKCESTLGEISYAMEWTSEDTIIPFRHLVRLIQTKCESMVGKTNYAGEQARPIQTKCESMVGIPVTLWNIPWKKPLSPISTWQVQNKMITRLTRLAAFIRGIGCTRPIPEHVTSLYVQFRHL